MGSETYAPIARTNVARLQRQVDDLISRCESLPPGAEIESDAYRYAYVRLCGLLEQALLWAGRALVHRNAVAEVRRFGLSFLERSSRNPTDDQILSFVGRFNEKWVDELEGWFQTDERGGTINSLVGIRNGIAHGTSFGGSKTQFHDYYVVVYELLDWLLDHFDPAPVPTTYTS